MSIIPPAKPGPSPSGARPSGGTGRTQQPEPSRRSGVPPFYVMEVMRAAAAREAAGERVLHLQVGQPSTPAPAGVLAAARHALDHHLLGYTGAAGLPELRERIAAWYDDRYGVAVEPDRVVVTTGASGSCVLAFLAAFDAGDRVAVLEPGYPCYRNDLLAFGVEVVTIGVGPDTGFRPTRALLEAAGELDGIIIASPGNPTGTVLDDDHLAELFAWAAAGGVTVIADEIYHGISFGPQAPTALAHSSDVVVMNSFSKYFSMTGWRLGWIVAPPALAEATERLAQSLTVAPPTLSQLAAVAAFDCIPELEANVTRYEANRAVLLEGLPTVGLDRLAPADGAFYVWADVSHLTNGGPVDGSQALCLRWLDELGLAATPGIDFDLARGRDWVRFSYAGACDDIVEAIDRLSAWRP